MAVQPQHPPTAQQTRTGHDQAWVGGWETLRRLLDVRAARSWKSLPEWEQKPYWASGGWSFTTQGLSHASAQRNRALPVPQEEPASLCRTSSPCSAQPPAPRRQQGTLHFVLAFANLQITLQTWREGKGGRRKGEHCQGVPTPASSLPPLQGHEADRSTQPAARSAVRHHQSRPTWNGGCVFIDLYCFKEQKRQQIEQRAAWCERQNSPAQTPATSASLWQGRRLWRLPLNTNLSKATPGYGSGLIQLSRDVL